MGYVHYLAGAMGIASWRVRATLEEYAQSVASPGAVLQLSGNGVVTGRPEPWSLNEVGVTDAAMAALWRHAPADMTYVVSSQAEAAVLGGDLAIVDGSQAIRVYQAKLVKEIDRTANEYVLKSPLTSAHVSHLRTGTFSWNGQTYRKTGYLALYQRTLPVIRGAAVPRRSRWWTEAATSLGAPHLGGVYYWDMMAGSGGAAARTASSRGIMAAPVPSLLIQSSVDRVPVADSWPWEYGVANGWTGHVPGSPPGDEDDAGGSVDDHEPPGPAAESMPTPIEETTAPRPAEERENFARALFRELFDDRPATLTVVFV